MIRKMQRFLVKHSAKVTATVLGLGIAAIPYAAQAYDIAEADSNGNVTFTPTGLVTPILTGAIAAVAAGASMVVLAVGTRWVYRAIKSK